MKNFLVILILISTIISCEEIIEVADISNETVTLLAPSDAAVVDTTNVSFNWNAVAEAESYHIQIATPTFSEAIQIVKDTLLTQTTYQTVLENKDYQWRVRAENSDYETVYTTHSFTVQE